MRPTKTILDSKAHQAILKGVNLVYNSVKLTFGPEGKNALLYGTFGREPRITNDGYTVAEAQEPKNIFVRLVAQIFRDSCKRTNEIVGDGTTTTTIIGGKLYNDIYTKLADNQGLMGDKTIKQVELKDKILKSAEKVKETVKKSAKKVKTLEELEKIAIISVRDEELGKLIAKMAWETGVDGFIDTVEGYKGKIETEIIKGMRFPAKVVNKAYVNNPDKYEMITEDTSVLITNHKLDNKDQLFDCLRRILVKQPKLTIIAPDFSQEIVETLYNETFEVVSTQNNRAVVRKKKYEIYPVKVPSLRTEQFEDIAVYFNASFINKDTGDTLAGVEVGDLGSLNKLVVKDTDAREDAVAIGGSGTDAVQVRIATLKKQLDETKETTFKNILKRRIASMASAVGVIRVGASSRAQTYYLKKKIEDAVYACKAALRGGYVEGGGKCLKDIADKLPETDILKNALLEPYNQIQKSGKVKITDEVIDPAEAIYYAVEHATSVVANLATVDAIIAETELPAPEEGSLAIANVMLSEQARKRIKDGLIKENEEEVWKDRYSGLSEDEYIQDFNNE